MNAALAGMSFSQIEAEYVSGSLDYLPPAAVAGWFLNTESRLSRVERDAMIEKVLRTLEIQGRSEEIPAYISALLARFDELESWSLRSRVLAIGGRLGLDGLDVALMNSAAGIVDYLSSPNARVPAGYEIEAAVLCSLAPEYPSLPLAELLRQIARISRDKRIVSAARAAARAIVTQLPTGGSN